MVPPIWVDELGRPQEKRPCPRCGEGVPAPTPDGRWRLIVVEGEGT